MQTVNVKSTIGSKENLVDETKRQVTTERHEQREMTQKGEWSGETGSRTWISSSWVPGLWGCLRAAASVLSWPVGTSVTSFRPPMLTRCFA